MSNIVESDGEHKWVSITGNGYNSTAGIAKLLILFLEGGLDGTWCHPDINHNVIPDGAYPNECQAGDEQDFVKLDTGFGVESGLPNGLGEPRAIDVDGNGTADYVYAGDLQGNFFRFDITDSDFNLWSVTKIFKAQYMPGTLDEKNQPITTQPIAIVHPTEEEGFIIIFGTGAYLRSGDSTDSEVQSIYGLWDRLGPALILKADLQVQSYTNVNDTLGRLRTLSDNAVDYSVSAIGAQKGWYNDLNSPAPGGSAPEFPGEKAVRNIQLRGGLSFVNSVFPREVGSCVGRAGGATLAFCPDTGGSLCLGGRTVFDLDNDGAFDSDDDINSGQTAAGIILEDPSPPTDSTFIDDKRVTQYGRELHIVGTNTSSGKNTGRLSWKRLETID
jgi:type IV pilus assembly protein PilY1